MRFNFRAAVWTSALWLTLGLFLVGCNKTKTDQAAGAPPKAVVETEFDPNNFKVDRPELFPLAQATQRQVIPALNVTGTVQPDIARAVPVISLASGRIVEIGARLGDTVKRGQLLLRVRSNDVTGAYQTYLKAVNDERLARLAFERAQILFDKGAIPRSALEAAEDTEQDAKDDLQAATELLGTLGVDKNHPSAIVNITAPISGVITDQQVTNAAGVQALASPNPFTISDLSYVWILCDVYENDLDAVRVGESADIRLNAYPGRNFKGRIDNILPILDPNLRTAKVRVEVPNPGLMKVGMFVTATFYGRPPVAQAVVPASAILHLHDREWVFLSLGGGRFRRQEVVAAGMLPQQMQGITSGIKPGDQVVAKALDLENTVEQ